LAASGHPTKQNPRHRWRGFQFRLCRKAYIAADDEAGAIAGASEAGAIAGASEAGAIAGASDDGAVTGAADEAGAMAGASDDGATTAAADEDEDDDEEVTTAELEAPTVVVVAGPRLKIQIRPMITITTTMMIIQVLRFMRQSPWLERVETGRG
jgi:hypothetical protein